MSRRNVLIVGLVLCGLLTLGFVAGKASQGTPMPPYTLTAFGPPNEAYQRFLLADSRSPIVRLITIQRSSEGIQGPRVVSGTMALTVVAEFDLDKLSGDGQATDERPAKP